MVPGQPVDCSVRDPAKCARTGAVLLIRSLRVKVFLGMGCYIAGPVSSVNPFGISHFPMALYPAVGGALISYLRFCTAELSAVR